MVFMKKRVIKTLSLFLILLILISSLFPITSSLEKDIVQNPLVEPEEELVEIYLLRVEHYLVIKATEDSDVFNVSYAFPPDYNYQTPVFLEIFDDTTADLINYHIENDVLEPNKLVVFTVNNMQKDEEKLIHFTAWVIVEHKDFSDLPKTKKFPKDSTNLPEDTKKWLTPTKVTQSDSFLIKRKARQLRFLNNDLIKYANKVSSFIINHRKIFFLLQLKLFVFFSQDALTTLLINGENVGRSHLACALFRCQNVPARVLLTNNDQGFWTQMHYMMEYYVPNYGWVTLCTTRGKTPFNTSRQVINRICYPEDENDTKTDYIFKLMKGEERWIWFDNKNIKPVYIDCKNGSKSQMFQENKIQTCSIVKNDIFNITRIVFIKYQKYLGIELSCENKNHFNQALDYQKQALDDLKNSDKPYSYIHLMELANDEYNLIDI